MKSNYTNTNVATFEHYVNGKPMTREQHAQMIIKAQKEVKKMWKDFYRIWENEK